MNNFLKTWKFFFFIFFFTFISLNQEDLLVIDLYTKERNAIKVCFKLLLMLIISLVSRGRELVCSVDLLWHET